jgi:gas vesicle protein
MAMSDTDKKIVVGVVLGVGLGLAAALLFAPQSGAGRRARLAERAREVADRVASLKQGPGSWRQRKNERARRTFMNRVERIRSAGL